MSKHLSESPADRLRKMQECSDAGLLWSDLYTGRSADGDRLNPGEDWDWRCPATFVDTPKGVADLVNTIVTASGLGREALQGGQPLCTGPAWCIPHNVHQEVDAEFGYSSFEDGPLMTSNRALKMRRAGHNLVQNASLAQKQIRGSKRGNAKRQRLAASLAAETAQNGVSTDSFAFYIDIEGIDLSRVGSVSIVQIFITPLNETYLVDVHTLGEEAFTTRGMRNLTLTDILQSYRIPKVLFDVRNDSDALYAHFSIAMENVQDVQLMELARRERVARRGGLLSGLARCIGYEESLDFGQNMAAESVKERGRYLMRSRSFAHLELFNQRPLRVDLWNYCAKDVTSLPRLRKQYWNVLTPAWRKVVLEESTYRTKASQECWYEPTGYDKVLSPWRKESLDDLRYGSIMTPAQPYEQRYPPAAPPTPPSPY